MPHRSNGPISARKLMQVRREIGGFLDPGLFVDPAYDILLYLLACEEEEKAVGLSECALVGNVAITTATRWIRLLEERKLVRRCHSADCGGATTLRLTVDCRVALRAYLDQVSDLIFE